jgi:hypothetical protein
MHGKSQSRRRNREECLPAWEAGAAGRGGANLATDIDSVLICVVPVKELSRKMILPLKQLIFCPQYNTNIQKQT